MAWLRRLWKTHRKVLFVSKYMARLVARGFLQKHGLDYNEVFAPVARLETVRLIVAAACNRNWSLYQLDVKSTFFNGPE